MRAAKDILIAIIGVVTFPIWSTSFFLVGLWCMCSFVIRTIASELGISLRAAVDIPA